MREFTQEELIAACNQIKKQRWAETQLAITAAGWLKIQLGFGNVTITQQNNHLDVLSSVKYYIVLTHETYGPYLEDCLKALDKMDCVKKEQTYDGHDYTVTTPYGVYPIKFEYFDNHCCGW